MLTVGLSFPSLQLITAPFLPSCSEDASPWYPKSRKPGPRPWALRRLVAEQLARLPPNGTSTLSRWVNRIRPACESGVGGWAMVVKESFSVPTTFAVLLFLVAASKASHNAMHHFYWFYFWSFKRVLWVWIFWMPLLMNGMPRQIFLDFVGFRISWVVNIYF